MPATPSPRPGAAIAHLDVDAFLASVEQALHPALAGRPVVVGGSPRSRNLVMSCSYEARRFGIRPGMRLAEAARRCRHAIFRNGDSQAANRARDAITRILLRFTPCVEVASIDDFFTDLTGTERLNGDAWRTAEAMRTAIHTETRLPITIGLASTKLMARLAGKLAKPGGIARLFPGHEQAFLSSLPVEHLPGVGHSTGARLERFAIHTVGELRLISREVLFASFGHHGLALYDLARGRDERPVESTHHEEDGRLIARPPRTIQRETTFEPEEGRREILEAMLAYLVERAAHRLRRHEAAAGSLEVRVRYVDTRPRVEATSLPQDGSAGRRRASFTTPTDSTDEIRARTLELFHALPRKRALVKRIGITLLNIVPHVGWQGRLFNEPSVSELSEEGAWSQRGSRADRQRRLDQTLDQLRAKLGFGGILRGSSTPLAKTHPWEEDGFRLRTPSLNQ